MELYHLLNRGVDKRTIFLDDHDRDRFVSGLEVFNDTRPAENTSYLLNRMVESSKLKREPLVSIHGWCLMRNHYHLLLSEKIDGGISKFCMKLNVGYAKYFNEKYKRSGTLFQGRTKKIVIEKDSHFMHILHYIHLNPLDDLPGAREWRQGKIKNASSAVNFLGTYQWSSYGNYTGTRTETDWLDSTLFKDFFGNYKKTLSQYLKDMEGVEDIEKLTLE